MKRITQHKIAKQLGVGQAFVSMVFRGKRAISWPMAERLSEIFPGKSIREWKYAKPDDVRRAFSQYEDVA